MIFLLTLWISHICVCVCGLGIAESAEKFKDVLLSADAGAEYDRVVEINLDEVRTVLYSLLTYFG